MECLINPEALACLVQFFNQSNQLAIDQIQIGCLEDEIFSLKSAKYQIFSIYLRTTL